MNSARTIAAAVICLCSFPVLPSFAQPGSPTYKFLVEGGGGYGLSKDSMSQAVARQGLAGTLRILWKPEHRLAVGIETGYLEIASLSDEVIRNEFGTSKLRASLKAIPVMAVFDMDVWNLHVYTGLGYYHVHSTVAVGDEEVTSALWNVGFYLSAAYKYPLADDVALCGELKWCSIGELGKTILLAQVFISYRLFEW